MELEKNGVENEKDIEEAFMAVEEAILFDLEAEMENRTESSENSFHPKKSFQYRSASPGDSRFYQCSVPTSTALGAGDVEFLVKESLKCAFNQDYEYWSEAAAVLISSAVWHPIDELQTLGIRFRFAYSTITPRTPPPALEMYADVGSEFYRVIPPNLVPLYSKLSLHGFPSKESVNRYLKQLRPWFTCSRLQQSLLNVCPTVWNYPPVLPILGFYPINEKSPALRSYCRVDARMISRSHRWVQFFDPAYDADSLHWSIGFRPCGSPNVPQVCELREFAAMIRSLLSQALPADTIDAINTLNAISAGLHLFGNVLMGGVRNWRMLIPDIASSGWIGYQKCHYLFHPPSFISEIIPLYEQRREEFCNRALEKGEKVDLIGIVNASLCLLKHDKKRVISPIEFTSSAIAMALLLCPATFRWKRLYSGALRHFSMSELYSAGFQSNDIEWFHHRSLSALHPFRSHRLEPVINPSLRAEMESHLRRVLEL